MTNRTRISLAAAIALGAAGFAHATVIPFTEGFSTGHANWGGGGDWQTFSPLAWSAPGTGGPLPGAGFVSAAHNFGDFEPGAFPALTIFRGQDNYNSSGGAFVGNWNASGIVEFSFWVRHDAPADLKFSVRFTPVGANSPSMNYEFVDNLVQGNTWTKLTLAIAPDTPGWVVGGGPNTYNTVFGNLGKIQIGVDANPLAGIDQDFNFDLSLVSVEIPAPGAIALFAIACFGRRRRRPPAV